MQKYPGQRSNQHHCRDLSHSNDNVGSLTCQATQELPTVIFLSLREATGNMAAGHALAWGGSKGGGGKGSGFVLEAESARLVAGGMGIIGPERGPGLRCRPGGNALLSSKRARLLCSRRSRPVRCSHTPGFPSSKPAVAFALPVCPLGERVPQEQWLLPARGPSFLIL